MIYDSTRSWTTPPVNIVLANNNEHGIYLKVSVVEGVTTSEWIVSESHIDPLRDDGYIIYKLGRALAVADGKRQISMVWGNSKNKTDWTEITNKPTTFPPSAHEHEIADVTGLQTALDNKINTSLIGGSNGLAQTDENGFVLNAQLPSYVDDVIERADFASLPIIGESGKIYITTNDNKTYRWSGSTYAIISDTLALGETYATAYRGDRGKIAYDYSQIGHLTLADSRISQWEEAYSSRIASFTNAGNSGPATLIDNALNIPNYTLAGLGAAPASGSANYVQVSPASAQSGNIWLNGAISQISAASQGTPIQLWSDNGGANNSYIALYNSPNSWRYAIGNNGAGSRKPIIFSFNDYGDDVTGVNMSLHTDGSVFFGYYINSPSYKLSGVDLFSSLTANKIVTWDGTKLINANFSEVSNGTRFYNISGTDISYGIGRSEINHNSAFFGWRYNSGSPYAFIETFASSDPMWLQTGNNAIIKAGNEINKNATFFLYGSMDVSGNLNTGPLTGTTANFSGAATAASFVLGSTGWSIEVVADKFTIKRNGIALKTLDASGNNKVLGDSYRGGL